MAKELTNVRGIAIWPHLNTADTKFDDAGSFHTKLRIEADVAAPIIARFEEMRAAAAAEYQKAKKGKKAKLADLPIEPEYDEETGEETGKFVLRTKMKASGKSKKTGKMWERQVPLFDSRGKPLGAKNYINSGAEIVVSFEPNAWSNPKGECSVTLYLEAVQVISLGGRSSSASAFGFGAVDGGYTASDEAADDAAVDEAAGEEEDGGYDFD